MTITIPYLYSEELIPPRCRKPRRVERATTITLNLREVSAADAPLALIERGQCCSEPDACGGFETSYRWYRRKLYVRASFQRFAHAPRETQTASQFSVDPYPLSLTKENSQHRYQTQAENRKNFRAWASSILFIDGERWEEAEEPRYVVMTFGLGHNHGLGWGTSLSTHHYYNPNISRERYFRVDEYQTALAEATRVALDRDDTKALPIEAEQNPTRFEILLPEAVRLKAHRKL